MPNFLASWRPVGRAITSSVRYIIPLVRGNALLILAFFITCEVLQHFFLLAQNAYVSAGMTSVPAMLGQVCVGLLMFVFYTMLVPLRLPEIDNPQLPRQSFWRFTVKHSTAFALENIRALAICVLWLMGGIAVAALLGVVLQLTGLFDMQSAIASMQGEVAVIRSHSQQLITALLAIVALGPFFYFYIRYYFVSYVVLYERDYDAGKINPLKRSGHISKGILLPVIIILAVFFALDAQRAGLRETYPVTGNPLAAVGIALVFEIFTVYANILLFQIYRLKVQGLPVTERSHSGINV